MHSTVVNHSEGCRISPQPHLSRGALYSSDSMQSVHFPPAEHIEYERQRHFTRKLLGHLERGVLVRANQEGIFIKRLCQSRVFWMGLTEVGQQYSPMPCKLERDAVVKIFDTGRFLQGAFVCLVRSPNASRKQCFGRHRLKTFVFLCVLQLCSCTRRVRFLLQIPRSRCVSERSSKISAAPRTN